MRKRLISLIAIIVVMTCSIGFTGCKVKRFDSSGRMVIRYWNVFPIGDPGYTWQMDKIAEFEELHPDIKIEYTGVNFWDYPAKLNTGMVDPSGPDLFIQDICNTLSRGRGGTILDISPYMPTASFSIDDYFASDLAVLKDGDKVYAAPFSQDCRVLYLNQGHLNDLKNNTEATAKYSDLVKEDGDVRAPKTFAELADYAKWLNLMTIGDLIHKHLFLRRICGSLFFHGIKK